MIRSAIRLLTPIIFILAGYVVLERAGVVPRLFTGASVVQGDQTRFPFKLSRNAFGDRLVLNTRMRATYVAQEGAPDRVDVLPNEGAFEGLFSWTVIPEQNGERRLLGEFANAGRVYKVCEFLVRSKAGSNERAERYAPINNSGPRFRDPVEIDPARLLALYDAILADENRLLSVPKGSVEAVNPSPELVTLASNTLFYCMGTSPPRGR